MAEVVNLRMARKRAVRAEKERQAEENRAAHSVPARERDRTRRQAELAARRLEGHRREPDADADAGGQ